MTITRAVKRGRLRETVVRDEKGRPCGISDFAAADLEWDANSDYTDAAHRLEAAPVTVPPEGSKSPTTLAEASVEEKKWRAKLAELKYREAIGELIPVKDAEKRIADLVTAFKTRLLGLPSRAKQADPSLSVVQIGLVENLVREALEEKTVP